MTTLKLKFSLLLIALLLGMASLAQNEGVSIKPNPAPPHASAMLDIDNPYKGLLIPRVSLISFTSTAPMASPPLQSLLVYNQGTAVAQGFYYWTGSLWKQLGSGPELWTKFSTSNDIQYYGGNVRIGNSVSTNTPQYDFEVISGSTSSLTCLFENKGGQFRWGYNDPDSESGVGDGNWLTQKTATTTDAGCSNSKRYEGARFSQIYNDQDAGLLLTSYGKCENTIGETYIEARSNRLHVRSNYGVSLETHSVTGYVTAFNNNAFVELKPNGWLLGSDSTLKKNITNEPSVLEKLMLCRPVTYNLKRDSENTLLHGFIAQEFENRFPELVSTASGPDKIFEDVDNPYKGKKGISYTGLISVLVKAIQEQQAQIAALQEDVTILKAK